MIRPLVSVGVPVYNGGTQISKALDGLIAQNYPNLEIIISDNGSTDQTSFICGNYVRKYPFIKYHYEDENRGIYWNFNNVFYKASGEYFMWAAHDDLRDPRFITECVAMLESNAAAVLCQSQTALIVEGCVEDILCVNDLSSYRGIHNIWGRYWETLNHFPATALYGVYRASAMRKTQMFRKCIATDLTFIQELSLHGKFIEVPEVLFTYKNRASWNTIDQDYKVFFGVDKKPWWYIPFLMVLLDNFRRLLKTDTNVLIKLGLSVLLLAHCTKHVILRGFIKLLGRVVPRSLRAIVGSRLYWSLMHGPNTRAVRNDLFYKRVIQPKIGW
jgi:glycosyltransferase involved in cell wall biosynthesis